MSGKDETAAVETAVLGAGRAEVIGLTADEARTEKRELRRRHRTSLLLAAPLLVFVLFAFAAPIAAMLYQSVYNPTLVQLIPDTLKQLDAWEDTPLPRGDAYTAMARELKQLAQERKAGTLGSAINPVFPGASSLINASARKMRAVDDGELAARGESLLREADARWDQPELWRAIATSGRVYTDTHYLSALDMERGADGEISWRDTRIYLQLYVRSTGMALIITLLCVAAGYPLAYYLAHAPRRVAGMLMVLVLLPFWTSVLVRTTAWIALLQTNGAVNSVLQAVGLAQQPLELLYTRFATITAMTHMLLPFMVLPLYSVMKGIDPSYVRAALSLGGRPVSAFLRVYLPLTLPGLSAGALLVFIIAVGYYITPALVGGADDQMISNIIAFHMQRSNNWGLAAALGSLLLVLVLALYVVYDRLVGARNIKLG